MLERRSERRERRPQRPCSDTRSPKTASTSLKPLGLTPKEQGLYRVVFEALASAQIELNQRFRVSSRARYHLPDPRSTYRTVIVPTVFHSRKIKGHNPRSSKRRNVMAERRDTAEGIPSRVEWWLLRSQAGRRVRPTDPPRTAGPASGIHDEAGGLIELPVGMRACRANPHLHGTRTGWWKPGERLN